MNGAYLTEDISTMTKVNFDPKYHPVQHHPSQEADAGFLVEQCDRGQFKGDRKLYCRKGQQCALSHREAE